MTDYLDIEPLFPEKNAQTLRTEMDADAEVLWPGVDKREGSLFWINTQPVVLALARVWDGFTETVAASKIGTAWGHYLDMHADSFGEDRKDPIAATGTVRFTGTNGTLIGTGTEVGPAQTDPDVEPPVFQTTESGTISGGFIDLDVVARDAGPEGNVAIGAITELLSPVTGTVTAVTNQTQTAGGTDIESDEDLHKRLKLRFGGGSVAGRQDWYQAVGLAYPGVGRVTVVAAGYGPGTVQLVVADPDGNPVSTPTKDGLQTLLDPVDAMGAGLAPIGHNVTVDTITTLNITVVADITLMSGFSLAAVQSEVDDAVARYVNALLPGEDVIYENVKATLFEVDGIYDIASVTVNGGTANVAVGSTQSPRLVLPVTIS